MGRQSGQAVLGLLVLAALAGDAARACAIDDWIVTTKAQIALLTTDGAGAPAVSAEAQEGGVVTLRGTVCTSAERAKAESVVRAVAGVASVNNALLVGCATPGDAPIADGEARTIIVAALASQRALRGISVASVRDGVVMLDGVARTLPLELRAIETAYECAGVRLVAARIEIKSDR